MSSLFEFETTPDQYAVMGNPISHSKSPLIHHAFAEQTNQRIRYTAIQVDPGGFPQAVGNFFAANGKGINVTVPFKQEAWQLSTERSERALAAGAVNTLKALENRDIYGDNTDGVGLVRDLTINLQTPINDQRILLVGAGGAARGVLAPLLTERPRELVVVNRTADRAFSLAKAFSNYGNVKGMGFDALKDNAFDIVINATSSSLQGELPALRGTIFTKTTLSYDMMYGAQPTLFLQWSQAQGVTRTADGLGMLVEQAAESFFIWRNIRPQTAPVIELIKQSL
jgi:shikimate dehydrogenase